MRHLRGAIVEKVVHPTTKRESVIRLDRRTMTFFAWEDDQEQREDPFSNSSGSAVRTWLLEQLKHTHDGQNMEWVPVVEIQQSGEPKHRYRGDEETHGHSVQVEVDRYFLGLTRDQREWRKLPWAACAEDSVGLVPENERYAQSTRYEDGPKSPNLGPNRKPFRLPSFTERYHHDRVVVEYTEELWRGLLVTVSTIKQAHATLKQMVTTKAGIAALTEVGGGRTPLLLTPGARRATTEG